jgi:DNA processing protein
MKEHQIDKDKILLHPVELPDFLKDLPVRILGNQRMLTAKARPRIAVIGSRDPGPEDLAITDNIVAALAEHPSGPIIISGLALGIDARAHRAALTNGLPTFAVLPCGLDNIYPYVHRPLAKQMTESHGGLVTVFPDGTAPMAINFLFRNALMIGMCDMVIVVCSKAKGSAMVGARLAKDLDIPVLAVAGSPENIRHAGCNQLIKEHIADILCDYRTLTEIKL